MLFHFWMKKLLNAFWVSFPNSVTFDFLQYTNLCFFLSPIEAVTSISSALKTSEFRVFCSVYNWKKSMKIEQQWLRYWSYQIPCRCCTDPLLTALPKQWVLLPSHSNYEIPFSFIQKNVVLWIFYNVLMNWAQPMLKIVVD